ncbi:MAG: transporter, partial [Clostridia bacterium]
GVGVNYSSGDYGTSTNTEILSIPFTARYDRGPLTLKATIPYLRITGGSTVIPGVGAVANTNPRGRGRGGTAAAPTTSTTATASGLGDTVLSATYNVLYDTASKFGVDVTGRAKIATADADKGLGTGENDYGAQVDAYRTYDRTTVFGGIGYQVLGSSSFIQLRNVWNVNLGAAYKVDEQDSAGLSFDTRQKVSDSASPQRELTAFWTRRLDRTWKAQAYALKGFANGSPDWGAGASVVYAF